MFAELAEQPAPAWLSDLAVLQDWHESGSLLQREGSLSAVFAALRERPTMERPLQVLVVCNNV